MGGISEGALLESCCWVRAVQSLRLNTKEKKKQKTNSCGSAHCRIHPDLCETPVPGACGSEHRGGAVAAEPPGCSPPCLQAKAALGSHFPEGRLAILWLGALPSQTGAGPCPFLHPTQESAAESPEPYPAALNPRGRAEHTATWRP